MSSHHIPLISTLYIQILLAMWDMTVVAHMSTLVQLAKDHLSSSFTSVEVHPPLLKYWVSFLFLDNEG
ncbi:hypothetical protein B7P43_G02853 [Cryptotermes secundus]|uniref:Uncharacterized protein n=1 Tax=Cryptotermes secundus TaxID=105785 RepID=A0A2J7RIL2_9NEOP|nr:hypothetical protein B7P43_G02853 [Cryptotermes secundus]